MVQEVAPERSRLGWQLGIELFIWVKPTETILVGTGVVLKLSPVIKRKEVHIKSKHWEISGSVAVALNQCAKYANIKMCKRITALETTREEMV